MRKAYACLLALALLWLPPSARTSAAPDAGWVPAAVREDFEGAWPAAGWTVEDASAKDGGEYLPGQRDCHPRGGRYALWLVGGGADGAALGCGENAPTEALARASYGPFDLTNATSASLIVHFWGRSELAAECGTDYLFLGSSYDGVNYAGTRFCGDWSAGTAGNGYHRETLDLRHYLGQSRVWVRVAYVSNATGADLGFMVDDLALEVETPLGSRRAHLPLLHQAATGGAPTPTPTPPTYQQVTLYPHGDYALQPSQQAAEETVALTPASPWREWSYELTGDIQGSLGADVTLQTFFSNACFRLQFYHARGQLEQMLVQSSELCVANETRRFSGALEGIDPLARPGDRLLFRIVHTSGAYGNTLIGGSTNAQVRLMVQE